MRTERKEIDISAVLGVKVMCPASTATDLIDEPITVEMELWPGAESILHIHPNQDEQYDVLTGTVDLFLNGKWSRWGPGQTVTIPKGSVHAYRNSGAAVARALNTHAPGLRFQEYLVVLEELIRQGKVTGRHGVRNSLYLSLHAVRYEREVIPVRPPRWVIRTGASVAAVLGLKL